MDSRELARLLRTQSDRMERKESAKNAGEVFEPVRALANDLGGEFGECDCSLRNWDVRRWK